MNDILRDLTAINLIAAIENNYFATELALDKWPKEEVHNEATMLWTISDIPFPLFNSILRAQLSPEDVNAAIQSVVARGRSRGVPLLWLTGPQSSPADLEKHLERNGFVCDGHIPGMAVELAKLKQEPPAPAGLRVQQVKESSTLKLWSQVCCVGFGFPDFVAEAFYEGYSHYIPEMVQFYLGWLDDRPVATSLQFLACGVAGIYCVATIPEARRRGIGAVMTALPLREARAMGYQAGILQASTMGVSVYRSLGFEEYCTIGQYWWSPNNA